MSSWREPEPEMIALRYCGSALGRLWFYHQQKGYYFSAREREQRVPLELGRRLVAQSSGVFIFVEGEPRGLASPQRPRPRLSPFELGAPSETMEPGPVPTRPQHTIIDSSPRSRTVTRQEVESEIIGPLEITPPEPEPGEEKSEEVEPLVSAVAALLDESNGFVSGTASELFDELVGLAEEMELDRDHRWPGSPSWLSRRLREQSGPLEMAGIRMGFKHDGTARIITLWRV